MIADVTIIDYSEAFDTVPHKRCTNKLKLCGIDGPELDWIKDFLNEREQQVLVDGVKSTKAEVTLRVPQGTVLGPLLFSIHINDMPEIVDSETKVHLFADDALVYRVIRDSEDQQTLQATTKGHVGAGELGRHLGDVV